MTRMRVRLTISVLAVVLVGLVVLGMVVEIAFSRAVSVLIGALETRSGAYATRLANELSFGMAANAQDEIDSILSSFMGKNENVSGLRVIKENGEIVTSMGNTEFSDQILSRIKKKEGASESRGDLIYSAAPITAEGGTLGYVLSVEEYSEARQMRNQSRLTCILTYLLVLILIASAVYYIGSRLTAPIEKIVRIAHAVASGNLTQHDLEAKGKDEMARLSAALNQMTKALRTQVSALKATAGDVLENASDVMSTTSQLSAAASQQASDIAETTATMEEIKQVSQSARGSAQQIVETSEKSLKVSREGLNAVDSSTEVVELISSQVQIIATNIDELRSQVGEIEEIITTVNQIAEQSNLLAVNASIEAAKAGEYGLGFSIVAHEVKNLAAQSKLATSQVRKTLTKIQEAIGGVSSAATAGQKRAAVGVDSIKNTGEVIRRLGSSISNAAEDAQRIAISANEQVVGLEQVAQAMNNVNLAATDNLTSAQKLEVGGKKLEAIAKELEKQVATYQVSS